MPTNTLINLGAAANDKTGTKLRSGGQIINDNFTRLFARNAENSIYVDPISGSPLNLGSKEFPLDTIVNAYQFATDELEPDEDNPVVIQLANGVHQSGELVMDVPHLHIAGTPASVIKMLSGSIKMRAANSSLSRVRIMEGGSNVGPLIETDTVINQATHLANIELVDVSVANNASTGSAIGRFAGDAYSCRFTSPLGTAMDWLFGGRLFGCNLSGSVAVIAKAVSNASPGSDSTRKYAQINGGVLEGKSLDTKIFTGLIEGQTEDVGNGVSWWPTILNGVTVLSLPSTLNVGVGSYMMRGTFVMSGCSLYGANVFYQCHDGYVSGSYLTQSTQSDNAFCAKGCRSFQWTGCSWVPGFADSATQDAFEDNQFCTISGGSMEEAVALNELKSHQHYIQDMVYLGLSPRQTLDYTNPRIAARFTAVDETRCKVASTSDFALATITVEFWFRAKTNSVGAAIGGFDGGAGTGWFFGLDGSSGTIYFIHGAQTTQDAGNAAAFDGNWHHCAFVSNGTTTIIFLDGLSIATGVAGAPSGATTLGIGCYFTSPFAANGFYDGDLRHIRISNSARYTVNFPTEIPQRFIVDANTVALWEDKTDLPYTWTDKTGNHDAGMPGLEVNGNFTIQNPFWVPINYALP